MISQQRIDELLFSEPNMVRIIRQVEQEATAELRAERDALRALLAEARRSLRQVWSLDHHEREWRDLSEVQAFAKSEYKRIAAALREGK